MGKIRLIFFFLLKNYFFLHHVLLSIIYKKNSLIIFIRKLINFCKIKKFKIFVIKIFYLISYKVNYIFSLMKVLVKFKILGECIKISIIFIIHIINKYFFKFLIRFAQCKNQVNGF